MLPGQELFVDVAIFFANQKIKRSGLVYFTLEVEKQLVLVDDHLQFYKWVKDMDPLIFFQFDSLQRPIAWIYKFFREGIEICIITFRQGFQTNEDEAHFLYSKQNNLI